MTLATRVTMASSLLPVWGIALTLALGCEEQARPTSEYPVGMTHLTRAEIPATTAGLTPGLRVSAELMRKCNVRFDNVEVAPRFGFDPTALDPQDEDVLIQVAECVKSGPLANRTLRLVGGRAQGTAKDYLTQRGVTPTLEGAPPEGARVSVDVAP
jgi:hypothetical protein